jgi:hypothetical protein
MEIQDIINRRPKFDHSFWSLMIESKGFEYVVRDTSKWGWHWFEHGDFVIGFHMNRHTFGPEDPNFSLLYKDKLVASWFFNQTNGITESVFSETQDVLDILDAILNPKLWPMCLRIAWANSFVTDLLAGRVPEVA